MSQPEKTDTRLKLKSNLLSAAQKLKKREFKIQHEQQKGNGNKHKGDSGDNELLILHGITSHIRIHIVRQKAPHPIKYFDSSKTINKISRKKLKHPVRKLSFKCPICPSHAELSLSALIKHIANNHKSNIILKCSFSKCDFSTNVQHFLKNHLANVHHQFPFQCSVCLKNFKNHGKVQVHMLSHASTESKKHICSRLNCGFSTHYLNNLKTHLQIHDLQPKYKCSQCGWRTKYKNNVAKHVMRIHGSSIKDKPLKCPQDQCNFTADSLSNINSHSRFHLEYKPFKCHLCKFSTKYKNNLKAHLGVHSELKPFECNLCERKVRTMPGLQDHVRRHLKEKPFKCSALECDYVAATRSAMKTHVYWRHSEETGTKLKSFECPICKKKFKAKNHLTSHCLTHTLEKPYSCSFCLREFGRNGSKNLHERCCKKRPDGLQIKPFKCDFCEKRFCATCSKTIHEMTFHQE